jgi:uncharacterized iron-regulated membrane protein
MTQKMKKLAHQLHLVLGLASGLVVMVVCLTGAVCLFDDELTDAFEPWRKVPIKARPQMGPERLMTIASAHTGLQQPSSVTVGPDGRAAQVAFASWGGPRTTVFLNPYDGRVTGVVQQEADEKSFFEFMMDGHRRLWLPREVGGKVVSYATLLFLVTLLTGLLLWLPRKLSRTTLRNGLTLKRGANARRRLFDLHNVLGFYVLLPLIVASFTGLIFGLPWFSRSVYWLTSGGGEMKPYVLPPSTPPSTPTGAASPDLLFAKILAESPDAEQLYLALPADSAGCYRVSVVHQMGSYYKQDNLFFDQYTLRELSGSGPWAGRYRDGTFADKAMHAALDFHEGRVLGLFGRILMFWAALIGASLPVTGFLMWRKRRAARQAAPSRPIPAAAAQARRTETPHGR